ncbi:MAG: hypothetical protein U0930_05190 [Pirellulales bacterium]
MKVTEKEVVDAFSGESAKSEQVINTLLRSIARRVGLGASDVDWDRRISVGDGGRDVIVHADHSHDGEKFLPQKRSYWSIKSGKDGLDKSTFRSEVRDHEGIQKWLVEGNVYVWCSLHDSTSDERQAIKDDVAYLVDEFNGSFEESQFEFRWIDSITEAINLNPGTIIRHMPEYAKRFENLISLDEWARGDPGNTEWVNFADRESLISHVINHFNSTSTTNVLHIAGISGIGKTRLVREACERYSDKYSLDVLYCASYADIESNRHQLFRPFHFDPRSALLVLDEVGLDQCALIDQDLASLHDTLRVVTICPSQRQPYTGNRQNIIVLPEPENADSVYAVISQNGAGVREEILRSVAERSDHDLRLALLLLKAVKDDPSGPQAIVGGVDTLLDRIFRLTRLSDLDRLHLRQLYEAASCFVDIGIGGQVKAEIESVKAFFGLTSENVRKSAPHAYKFGLSAPSKNERYFEATPRALATMVFAECCWDRIVDDLDEFYQSLPDRLRKRFIDRCNDCTGEIRERVVAQLSHYFLGLLQGFSIKDLERTAAAKIFKSWAELDPAKGLSWLATFLELTPVDDLKSFSGDSSAGDYRGRRYIVWLCESLARFTEYFHSAERILFRLAIAENEQKIGNNATRVWRNLFWPTLSQVSTPFADRVRLLKHRLSSSEGDARRLCVDCSLEVLQPKTVGMAIPPQVVGGRLVPEPWRANSTQELMNLRTEFARDLLVIVAGIPSDEKDYFDSAIPNHLMPFAWLNLVPELRATIGVPKSDNLATQLVAAIRRSAKIVSNERYGSQGTAVARQLHDWEDSISPAKLADRVKFWIQQNPWDVNEDDSASNPFERLAEEIVLDPSSLNSIAADLSDPRFNGTITLASFCGGKANNKELDELIKQWIARGESSLFVTGFLLSRSKPDVGLDEEWRASLDAALDCHPEYVGNVTAYVDASLTGYKRIAAILDNGFKPVTKMLSQLGFGHWTRAVTAEVQLDICTRLEQSLETEPNESIRIAFDLLYMWIYVNEKTLPQHLFAFSLKFLEIALERDGLRDSFKWMDVARHLVAEYPRRIAELAIEAEIDKLCGMHFDSESLDELVIKCADVDRKAVMNALGQVLLDEGRNAIYSFYRHDGVFEAIGVPAIEEWLAANGSEALPHIASHLASPRSSESGEIVLSDVLQWLFTKHEFNDAAMQGFLSGRHRFETWWGDDKATEVEQQMQLFLTCENRRVREWASWEIEHCKRMQDWFDEIDENRDRS